LPNLRAVFVRRGEPGVTILSVEDGKFICPPGGSYAILLSNPETAEVEATGRISFQWWEEENVLKPGRPWPG